VLGGGAGLQMQAKVISPELAPSSCCTEHPAGKVVLLLRIVPCQRIMHKTAGDIADSNADSEFRQLLLGTWCYQGIACQSDPSSQLHIPIHHCACITQEKMHKRTQGTEPSLIMSLVRH